MEDSESLLEILFGRNWAVVFLVLLLPLSMGCGRKWEQLWGQDTKPETRYIPLTPDQVEFG